MKVYARRAIKVHTDDRGREILPGETYYRWYPRRAGRKGRISKTVPTRKDLTESAFLHWLYDFEDGLRDRLAGAELSEELETIAGEMQGELDDIEDSISRMPEHFHDGGNPAADLLIERRELLEEWMSTVEGIDTEESSWESALEEVEGGNPF